MDPKQVCQICFHNARPGEKHYAHYGAICCFCCKAFFRRIYREDLVTKLSCKTNGNCDLRQIKRTECKLCRLTQCLKVGLDPQKVLLHQRDRIKFSHPKGHSRKRKNKCPLVSNTDLVNLPFDKTNEEEKKLEIKNSPDTMKEIQISQDNRHMTKESSIVSIMCEIQNIFHLSFTDIPMDQELVVGFLQLHEDQSIDWNFEKALCFTRAVDHYRLILNHFLKRNQLFQALSQSDKSTLMENNFGILTEYLLSQYFSLSTGLEQVNWILGTQIIKRSKQKYVIHLYN